MNYPEFLTFIIGGRKYGPKPFLGMISNISLDLDLYISNVAKNVKITKLNYTRKEVIDLLDKKIDSQVYSKDFDFIKYNKMFKGSKGRKKLS